MPSLQRAEEAGGVIEHVLADDLSRIGGTWGGAIHRGVDLLGGGQSGISRTDYSMPSTVYPSSSTAALSTASSTGEDRVTVALSAV